MKMLFIFTSFVSIVLLVILSQITPMSLEVPQQATYMRKTLFLDRTFTEDEVEYITSAALEWTDKTNHTIDFNVVILPNMEEFFGPDDILVVKASPDYPDILVKDIESGNATLGLYTSKIDMNVIYLVSSRITNEKYKAVMLHELGHALGLDHNEGWEGINTLMYAYADLSASHITNKDLIIFCEKYKCKSQN